MMMILSASFFGDEGSRNEQQDVVILDWAVKACGKHRITLYPVGLDARTPNPSCTGEGKAQKRRDPSTKAG
jgi:hypothetical protein